VNGGGCCSCYCCSCFLLQLLLLADAVVVAVCWLAVLMTLSVSRPPSRTSRLTFVHFSGTISSTQLSVPNISVRQDP